MIVQIKKVEPIIGFDFGLSGLTASAGVPVTVWMDAVYDQDAYNFGVGTTGADVIDKVSNFQYKLTYNAPGTYEIFGSVTAKDKGESLQSNTLTIIIE